MKIETLYLTGRNNHDWVRSAPFCRDLLENTGLFNVTVIGDVPNVLLDRKDLEKYQLIFLDYLYSKQWPEEARENFVDVIRKGCGLCVFHAANNGHVGWKEFEEICGLVWREGTSHGAYHKFDVKTTHSDHPITKGLPPIMKNHPDELYHNMQNPQDTGFKVLATAFSSEEYGGTGRDEPAFLVKNYGEGRVFHCILGHVWKGGVMDTFENPDFQRFLLRGCEWAATGQVTIYIENSKAVDND